MKTIAIIPARAGSQGLPGKNYKVFMGKPLVQHSMEQALAVFPMKDVVISTNCEHVLAVAKSCGWNDVIPRPEEIAQSHSTMREVLLHEVTAFEKKNNCTVDQLVLLQPTSPLRIPSDIQGALAKMEEGDFEMVMSVYPCKQNPYSVVMEYNQEGFLQKVKSHLFTTRQSTPPVYCINGAVYVIDVKSLMEKDLSAFSRIGGFGMPENRSIDIDTDWDWYMAEKAAEYIKFA
jgi:N-acylneuraminate cytidylyltransferase